MTWSAGGNQTQSVVTSREDVSFLNPDNMSQSVASPPGEVKYLIDTVKIVIMIVLRSLSSVTGS